MSTIFCMNCGAELDEGARFCTECGSPTLLGAGLVEAPGKAQVACPTCGTLNDSSEQRCTKCGARLTAPAQRTHASHSEGHAYYGQPEGSAKASRSRTLLIGAVAGVAVLAVALGGLLASGVLGGNKRPSSSSPTGVTASLEPADSSETETQDMGAAGTEVRDSLADYTWEELSIIGKEMNRKASREEALALAKEYHLVDDEGNMTSETKEANLIGIGAVAVRLIDVYHDNLANGEGKAGLTFMAWEIPFTHSMNATGDNTGGWEECELRSWLNTTIYSSLEEGLRTSIVAVDKQTNNTGRSHDASSVTSTIDMLWLPSMVEIIGPIEWTWQSDPDNSSGYNAIANAEGSQYALFAQLGIQSDAGNKDIVLESAQGATTYWERSCTSSKESSFRTVSVEGNPISTMDASNEFGVCLCFCL